MSGRVAARQNRPMANAGGEAAGRRAPRPDPGSVRHRRILASGVSLLATLAVTVPLAYQAHEARSDRRAPATRTPVTAPPPVRRDPTASVLPSSIENPLPSLRWASTVDDPDPAPLDGATLHGAVVISVDAAAGVRVEFWIDRTIGTIRPMHTDDRAPFTLSAVATDSDSAYDTRRLRNGAHVVAARVTYPGGAQIDAFGTFTVDNHRS